jgi:hypothetical protein
VDYDLRAGVTLCGVAGVDRLVRTGDAVAGFRGAHLAGLLRHVIELAVFTLAPLDFPLTRRAVRFAGRTGIGITRLLRHDYQSL